MKRPSEFLHSASEQLSEWWRTILPWFQLSSVRGIWGGMPLGLRFWPQKHPVGEGSIVNYEMLRSMYRNDGENALGAAFARPIIDLTVQFVGMPIISTGNEATDEFLNECVQKFWTGEIQQMLRDSCRDSKTIVRIIRPDVFDPLMTVDEAEHCAIEIIVPDIVDIERNPVNKRIIERAVVHHRMKFVIEEGSVEQGRDPLVEEHDVLEILDRQQFRFFDNTTGQWLTNFQRRNRYGFVPLLEVMNEFDSALQGGQSDLETVIPFIQAFHDVLTQGLQAHTYHSTPKVTLNLADIGPFIKNNFPEALDPQTGAIKPHSEISWRGREILFLQTDDKISFLEARSVLGDTRLLLEFLIDCICIASQTPEWAFMRVDSGSANSDRNAQTVPFLKKIERKRINFQKPVQELCKMALVMSSLDPTRPSISWQVVRPDDEVVLMQAFQLLVMGLEAAADRGEISDTTYRRMIKTYLPMMKSAQDEKVDAEKDKKAHDQQQAAMDRATMPPQISPPQSGRPKQPPSPVPSSRNGSTR